MTGMRASPSLVINAPPAAVLDAFFDAEALAVWWQVSRSVCIPRPLGSYAVEWEPTEWRDDVLGPPRRRVPRHRHGVQPGPGVLPRRAVLAAAGRRSDRADGARSDLHAPQDSGTLLHVRQSGYDRSSPRWTRLLRHHARTPAGCSSRSSGAEEVSSRTQMGSGRGRALYVGADHTRCSFRKFEGRAPGRA